MEICGKNIGWSGNMLCRLWRSCPFIGMLMPLFVFSQEPLCSTGITPADGAANVDPATLIVWSPVPNATHYILVLGEASGSTGSTDSLDLGNSNSYRPPSGLMPNTTYNFKVIPANNEGLAIGCMEQRFTTGEGGGVPGCVTLRYPLNGAYGISPDTAISWYPQAAAEGYLLSVGTTAGAEDLLPETDLGNTTTYTFPSSMPLLQQIFIRVTPYNGNGEQPVSCSQLSFRTRGTGIPQCTEIINPRDGDLNVSVTANITWLREFNAEGYIMTIEEKAPGGVRIMDNVDVGGGTNFKPPNFLGNTRYFVTLTPYNDLGAPMSCTAISFTTAAAPDPPGCTTLISPAGGASDVPVTASLEWEAVPGARGYILSVGTSQGAADITDRSDLGNETTFTFPEALPGGEQIYVRIIPYSNWGQALGCAQQSFTTTKPVFLPDTVSIPKFFTPNNDGYNDQWIVRSTPEVTIDKVLIFNRFGKLIKQIQAGQPWDGSFNGRPLASDSYWYKVKTSEGREVTGYFLLKR
jgi:gliding motility-associated-like protein